MPTNRPLGWVFCGVLASGLAAAQGAPLDLPAALQAAEVNNLELRAARQQRALALAGLTTARQFPNPTVSFSAARDTPHEGFTWDQPIELGGKRGKRVAVAQAEQQATETDIAILGRQIRRRTREAFYRVLAAQEQAGQAKEALDLATRLHQVVQQRFEAGDVAQLEVVQADVEQALAAAGYELAVAAQRSAQAGLAALLNRAVDQPLAVSGRMEALPPAPTLATITETALRASADVLKTTQELQIEQRRLALARAQRVPNLDLSVGTDFNSPPDFNTGGRGQIAVTLPLFYRSQGEIALSNARLEFLRLILQSAQTLTAAGVAAAYFDYQAKARQAQQYQQTILPQSLRLESMAEDSYRSGKSNLLTVIDAQRRLNEVRRAYVDSLLAVQSAFAALEETVGISLD